MELFSVDRIEENIVILIKDGKAFNYPLDDFDFSVKEGMLLSSDSYGKFRYEKEISERVKKALFQKQNDLCLNEIKNIKKTLENLAFEWYNALAIRTHGDCRKIAYYMSYGKLNCVEDKIRRTK